MAARAHALRTPPRRRSGVSAVGGFTVGLLAVSSAFLFAGSGDSTGPMSEAAEIAARAAGARIAAQPAARPSNAVASVPAFGPASPQAFGPDGTLFSPQSATRVVIRSIGVDAPVRPVGYVFQNGQLEYDVPRMDAGEYVTGAQVGKPGNAVIGGHVSRRGVPGVFAKLPQVAAGDVVEVYRGDRIFRYSITEIRIVAPDATSVMSQTHEATLTLITCFPDAQYQDRLVVVGRLL
ncbi:MAG: class F sortase [Dehalococcoidia bacterium]